MKVIKHALKLFLIFILSFFFIVVAHYLTGAIGVAILTVFYGCLLCAYLSDRIDNNWD